MLTERTYLVKMHKLSSRTLDQWLYTRHKVVPGQIRVVTDIWAGDKLVKRTVKAGDVQLPIPAAHYTIIREL